MSGTPSVWLSSSSRAWSASASGTTHQNTHPLKQLRSEASDTEFVVVEGR